MTPDQQALYPVTDHHYHAGTRSAGLAFDFYTDSETLSVVKSGTCAAKRAADVVDVLIDGRLFSHQSLWRENVDATSAENRPYGPDTFLFLLPKGEKRVTIVPHYALSVDSLTVELADGSAVCISKYIYLTTERKTLDQLGGVKPNITSYDIEDSTLDVQLEAAKDAAS